MLGLWAEAEQSFENSSLPNQLTKGDGQTAAFSTIFATYCIAPYTAPAQGIARLSAFPALNSELKCCSLNQRAPRIR